MSEEQIEDLIYDVLDGCAALVLGSGCLGLVVLVFAL